MLKRLALWLLFLPLQLGLALVIAASELLRLLLSPLRGFPAGPGSTQGLRPGLLSSAPPGLTDMCLRNLPPAPSALGDACTDSPSQPPEGAKERSLGRKPQDARADEIESPGGAKDLCSIVMLNWNGRRLLEESLPALERAVVFTGQNHEIIVVDNGSTDDSIDWLKKNHARVRVVPLTENLGFGAGNNRGVEAAVHEIVVLLNNDMVVEEDFLPFLLEPFADPRVFAVSSQVLFPEDKRREETGNTQARFERGYLHLSHEPIQPYHASRRFLPVLWAGGGSSAFCRRRFLELGGFSALFSPCYLEDTDLSYRAWRRGWKVLLAAESRVLHKHRSSSSARFSEQQLRELVEERKLWYLWKNYQLRTLAGHFLSFPLNLTKYLSVSGYFRSLRRLPQVLRSRIQEPPRAQSDAVLFDWIRHPLLFITAENLSPLRGLLTHSTEPRAGALGYKLPPLRGSGGLKILRGSSRLKILIVSAYLPHLGRHGGAGRVFQLLRQVAKNHEVSLVTFVESDEEMVEVGQVRPYCKRVETVWRRGFEPVSLYPYEPFEEFNCAKFRQSLEQIFTEEDFDIVHFEWTQMAQYADLAPPYTRKLVTEIEVNYAAHHSLVPLEHDPLKKMRKYYNSLQTLYREIELCRKMDAVVCVTDADCDYLRGYLPAEKLFVINTGVDTRYFVPNGAPPDPDGILFVGAFRHEPNVDAMLYFSNEVFPLILSEQPRAQLYVVGSGPPPEIEQLDAHANITVTGLVPDIRDYYHRAQVVVVPLRTGVGIRGKILEAWSAGKPAVATSLACQGIRARHGENIFVADNPREFAMWTLSLLRDREFGKRLGWNGRQTATRYYDWNLLGEQMTALYERLACRES